MHRISRMLVLLLLLFVPGTHARAQESDSPPVYDIPKLEDIVIDGRAEEWGAEGFAVEALLPLDDSGQILTFRATGDLDARVRLGWDQRGLLVLADVRDDRPVEDPEEGKLWQRDGIELFLATHPGGADLCQWVVAPGVDPDHSSLRWHGYDFRKDPGLREQNTDITAARTIRTDGYMLEALLPWSALGVEPEKGRIVGFQFWVNDVDDPAVASPYHAAWYPAVGTGRHSDRMYSLRLADGSSPAVRLRGKADPAWPLRYVVRMVAPARLAGESVKVRRAEDVLAESVLVLSGGRAYAEASIPFVEAYRDKSHREIGLYVNSVRQETLLLPPFPDGDPLHLRLFDESQGSIPEDEEVQPQITSSGESTHQVLVVDTDVHPGEPARGVALQVEVVGVGGTCLARSQIQRGMIARFETEDWAAGPYEVRVTQQMPGGRIVYKHLPWYKGDWPAHARALLDACDKLPARCKDPDDLRLQLLGRLVLNRLGRDPRKDGGKPFPDDRFEKVHSALLEHRELQQGPAAQMRPHGFLRLAWRDDVDDSPQYAQAHLPAGYDPSQRWPMIVWLHGWSPPNPEYVERGIDHRHPNRWLEAHNTIFLKPHGRGNSGYRGIGEKDVMTAIRLAKETFSVDEDRVYLLGASMGGGGTTFLGSRYPELFAVIAPLIGVGHDYRLWMGTNEMAKLDGREQYLLEKESTFSQAEALLTTPVFIQIGDADEHGMVNDARFFAKMLHRWGYNIRYWEAPGMGHVVPGSEGVLRILKWLLPKRRIANPRHVRVRAAELKSAHAHWVAVEQREDPWQFVYADARVIARDLIRLDTFNVLQIRLSPDAKLVEHGQQVRVIWNGEEASHAFVDGALALTSQGYVAASLEKTSAIEGPIDHATTTPFAIVVGTISEDERMRTFIRRAAELQRDGWKEWQHVVPRYFLDNEITDEHIRQYSLFLFGGPADNAVTRKLIDRIPLKVDGTHVEIDGHAFESVNAAVRMVYPNPLNRDRYVVVRAATSPEGMFNAAQLPGSFDFTISDGRVFIGDDVGSTYLAEGFFDRRWRYSEAYVRRGDPEMRARAVTLKAPRYLTAAVETNCLMLADVLETKATGRFKHMQRDLNWQQHPIQLAGKEYAEGIGVHVAHGRPSILSYDLSGTGWKRLRGTIGIQIDDPEDLTDLNKQHTAVTVAVVGDGKQLYQSPTFSWNSQPATLDVDIEGVNTFEIRVSNKSLMHYRLDSVNLAAIRLER